MNNKKILSKGWKLLALNEICDLQNGYAFKSNDYINISNTLNCRMSNIRPDGFFDIEHNQKFLPDSYIEKYKQYLLKDGDVIIAMTDMATEAKILGVPTIVKTQGKNLLLNQRVGKLIIKKPELINFPYLKYVLNREQVKKYFLKFAGGGLQINLGKEDILSVEIPLPPIAEQKRIAEILDRTQSLISKRKEAIAKLDTLTQSIFLEMFGDPVTNPKGWDIGNLLDIADFLTGYPFKSADYTDKGKTIKLCRGANVLPNRIDWSDLASWSVLKMNDLSEFALADGDVVIAMDRPWISEGFKIAQIHSTDLPALLVQRVARLRGKNSVSNSFIFQILRFSIFARHCKPTETTIPHISPKDIKTFGFPIPSLPLQKEFAQRVEAVEKLKARHRASLSQLQALFASLQHRAFRGEL